MLSGVGVNQERVCLCEGEASESCCVCSGKAAPGAQAANAALCAGKKIAVGFDQLRTHHQKITARMRRAIPAASVRTERAQGEKL